MRCLKIFSLTFCVWFFMIISNVFAEPQPFFKQVIFFGDSLSDNGNFYAHSADLLPKYPPYYKGRFSNGYNWADLLSDEIFEKYGIESENYAVGGATAYFHNPFDGYLPVTLTSEREDYDLRYLLSDKSDTLYIIWIGANDYLPGNNDVDGTTTNVVQSIVSNVEALINNPGSSFFIIGMPDLAYTPEATLKNLTTNYEALSKMHNEKLHAAILQLRAEYPDHKIIEFSFLDHPILKEMVESADYRQKINSEYHIHVTDVTDPCWPGGFTKDKETDIKANLQLFAKNTKDSDSKKLSVVNYDHLAAMIANSPALQEAYQVQKNELAGYTACAAPDAYLFWDHMHPTAVTHKVLFNMFSQALFSG